VIPWASAIQCHKGWAIGYFFQNGLTEYFLWVVGANGQDNQAGHLVHDHELILKSQDEKLFDY